MIFAYTRVSTTDQNAERQRVAIDQYSAEHDIQIDRYFEDKASGRNFQRRQYQSMKDAARAGDIIIFKELDRMGRNMEQIKQEWDSLQNAGIDIIVTDTPMLNTANKADLEKKLIANIVFELLAYMAEKERIKIHARQAEGIALAKTQGKYKGRMPLPVDNFPTVYQEWKSGNITAVQAYTQLQISKATFYRRVREQENGGQTK